MVRLKITKPHKKYKVGETVYVTPNEAHGLIDGGFAERTKDLTATDYRTHDGRPTKLRINKRK
jgi:quercetin dioxygenase-like cupin family protein